MPEHDIPAGAHVTYSRQFRRCNKPECARCRADALGHGPYWYAYWREDGRLRSRYLGRTPPDAPMPQATPHRPDPADETGAPPSSSRRPSASQPVAQVRTLGGFAIWAGDRLLAIDAGHARMVLTLFKCLLSMPRQRADRELLVELLWPDASPEAGPRNLRVAVHRLRQVLDRHAAGIDCVRAGTAVQIVARSAPHAQDWLDAEAFEQAARAALAGHNPARCRAALALYGGAYLPEERYADWAVARREELEQLHLSLLLHLARLRERSGVLGEAVRCLRRALAIDPCHEQAARTLIRLLARTNRRAEAMQVYRRLATALERDLRLQPEAETQTLYRALLDQDAGGTPRTNLPTPLTSFIGREHDLATLSGLLRHADVRPAALAVPSHPGLAGGPDRGRRLPMTGEQDLADRSRTAPRLLTLLGMGGCGKTRLAVELGHELLAAYAQGIWYVDLAPIPAATAGAAPDQAAERVSRAIVRALELREEPGSTMLEVAAQVLRDWQALLILDNCEHLVAACATVASALLGGCPRLCIIATSREALAVLGEMLWRVQPLAVPDLATGDDWEVLASFPALRLIVERARAVQPAFALDPRSGPAAHEICRTLDGIPLAIELAAARLGSLSIHELAARLDDRFRLLVAGNRSAAPRHQTLQATLDWSYSLLDTAEQTLLRRLAVFAGGCTLAAAAAVCADEAVDVSPVLPLLAQLVTKSLVQQVGDLEESRFALLETVRHYGWERLAPAERAAVQARHAAWCLALAEQAEPELTGAGQTTWLERLEAEHDNLRAALAWSLHAAPRQELRLAKALRRFWRLRGHLREGRHWLRMALAADDGSQPRVRAGALLAAGGLAHLQGDGADARALKQQALALFEALGDQEGVAESAQLLASEFYLAGDVQQALVLLERARSLFERLAHPWGLAATLNYLAGIAHDQSDYARAETLYAESLALSRQVGDRRGIGVTLHNLGRVALDRGDIAGAQPLLDESLRVRRALGEGWGIARSLTTLGELAQVRRAWSEATALYEEALALLRALGARRDVCITLNALGQAAYHLDDTARALALAQESLALAQEWGFHKQAGYAQYLLGSLARRASDLAQALTRDAAGVRCHRPVGYATGYVLGIEGIAATATRLGDAARAVTLYAAATAWRAAQREPRWPADEGQYARDSAALRAKLGEEAYAAAWQAGCALTLDEAAARALHTADTITGEQREAPSP